MASDKKKTVVIFQTDTRPPGVLNEKEIDDDLNRCGKLMHNVNKVQGWEAGLYLFFDASSGPFKKFPVYWLSALLFWFLRIVFPEAHIMYADSDCVICLAAVLQRLAQLPPSNEDRLILATDVNGPVNAGWYFLLKSGVAQLRPEDFDPSNWNERCAGSLNY